MNCPKCSHGRIVGPGYRKNAYGQESLLYMCAQCGYEWRERCHDADKEERSRRRAEKGKP